MMEKSPSPAEKGVGAVILSLPSKVYAAFGVPSRSVASIAPLTSPCRVPALSSALPLNKYSAECELEPPDVRQKGPAHS